MANPTGAAAGGTSIFTLLLAAFVVLKLLGVIHWSWWWVLSPLWGPMLALTCSVVIFLLISLFLEFAQ